MNKIKFLLTLSIFFFSLLISTKAFSKDCGKLTIADMNWGSATLMAHVDKVILQKGYDCDVDMVVGDTVPVFTGMKDKGSPDVAPELWVSTVTTLLNKAEKEGKLTIINKTPINGLGEGWFVTPGTLERHPELKNVMDVLKNPQLFPHPEDPTKGAFVTCPSGWGCQRSNANLFRAFDMEAKGWKLLDPGSSAGLDGTIAKASLGKKNWFGFYWIPTALAGKYNMQMLDWGIGYAGDDNWNNCISKPVAECSEPKPTAWTTPVVSTVVTKNFMETASSDAIEFLGNRVWDTQVLNSVLDHMNTNSLDGADAAIYFLKNYEDKWTAWVSDEVELKIKSSL